MLQLGIGADLDHRDATLVRAQHRNTQQHHCRGRSAHQAAALGRLFADDDLVERLQFATQGHVVERNDRSGLNMAVLCKASRYRALGLHVGLGNDAARHVNISAGLQQAAVHGSLDQNIATGLHLHAVADLAVHLHRPVEMDIARGHVDFAHAQDGLHLDTLINQYRLTHRSGFKQVGVIIGGLGTGELGCKGLVESWTRR